MALDWRDQLIFGSPGDWRQTQDSPVLPDVWKAYADRAPDTPLDLLMVPHRGSTVAQLASGLREHLRGGNETPVGPVDPSETEPVRSWRRPRIAYNESSLAATFRFSEMIAVALPLSRWWAFNVAGRFGQLKTKAFRDRLAWLLDVSEAPDGVSRRRRTTDDPDWNLLWLVRVVGVIAGADTSREREHLLAQVGAKTAERLVEVFTSITEDIRPHEGWPLLWSISRNRAAFSAVFRSVPTVKADAARRLFQIDARSIGWAVIDSGIDAAHPAFRQQETVSESPKAKLKSGATEAANQSRVRRTFDLISIRDLLDVSGGSTSASEGVGSDHLADWARAKKRVRQRLAAGQSLDWESLLPLVERCLGSKSYETPRNDHGTHVAGILAGNWLPDTSESRPVIGVAPDISLYDFRVLDELGRGNEFAVIAALQLIRYLNSRADKPLIHGVNVSLSMHHDVANFACGRTPVCDECERLVKSGVVVVVAAGNEGYERTDGGTRDGYRSISITDPGNTEAVITVGSTHRLEPHNYGVSYFSSRGPTGDGRIKPDLVAPGEKIESAIPGHARGIKDGTSMAAPYVSGAAALLMARHVELKGQPDRVKAILCDTATNLGRERYFQGHGLVDVLRALQSI